MNKTFHIPKRLCDKVTYMEKYYGQYWFRQPDRTETYANDEVWLSIVNSRKDFGHDEDIRKTRVVIQKGKQVKTFKTISSAARSYGLTGNIRKAQLKNKLVRRGYSVKFVTD